jgi:hypothetical protein
MKLEVSNGAAHRVVRATAPLQIAVGELLISPLSRCVDAPGLILQPFYDKWTARGCTWDGRDRGQKRRDFGKAEKCAARLNTQRPHQPFRKEPRHDAAPTVAHDASVKWFNADKGFGFVELADGSGDVPIAV